MNIDDLTLRQVKELNGLFGQQTAEAQNIFSSAIGKYVIVRSRNEGINAGILSIAGSDGCILKDAIRIWYHKPKDSKTAWYKGVAVSGLHSDSKVSVAVPEKYIVEDYSITVCSDVAMKSIKEHKPNES